MPEAAPLALLRAAVDRQPNRIKAILLETRLRKEILGGIPSDEGKAVKAFVGQNTENALKTKPKVSCLLQAISPPRSNLQRCTLRSHKVW